MLILRPGFLNADFCLIDLFSIHIPKNKLGMATISPMAVVIKALEIPPASWEGSGTLSSRITRKAWIIPVTVPRRPKRVAVLAMIGRNPRLGFKAADPALSGGYHIFLQVFWIFAVVLLVN
jgi:hypothetical protein